MSGIFSALLGLVVGAFNDFIAGIAVVVSAVLGVLPGMPTFPEMPVQFTNVMGWINWFFPVGTVVDIVAFLVSAWLVWLAVRIVLNWARVVAE